MNLTAGPVSILNEKYAENFYLNA